MTRQAIFLDRDGTLNEEVSYLDSVSRFRLFDWAPVAVRALNEAGLPAIVVTNQAGVARGYFTAATLQTIHDHLRAVLAQDGAELTAIYYCLHHPTVGACDCRKPQPGLLRRAARDFDLELSRCWMIGDRYLDIETAHAAGARGALVLTGYGREQYEQRAEWPRPPELVAENVLEAVRAIIRESEFRIRI